MLFKKNKHGLDAKWRWIGLAGKLFIDALFSGARITVKGYEPVESLIRSGRCIFAFWHSRILLPSYHYKGLGATILVSNSADGEIIAQIIMRQGHYAVRGSTGKGGLRALTRQIHDIRASRRPGAVVPDGPQGPMQKVQPGVILLAQKTGCPIIPITYSSKWRITFNSWDRFILPFPFSPGIIIHGRPLSVPERSAPEQLQGYINALENELNRITFQADRFFGHAGTDH